VAVSFIPNPENKTHVNHIHKNKLNNNVSNIKEVLCQKRKTAAGFIWKYLD